MKIYLSNELVIQSCIAEINKYQKELDKLNLKWWQQGNPFSLKAMDSCKYENRISELETLKAMVESNTDLNCEVTNHEFLLLRGEI
jgi:hypothetical protein